jgi:hypothetical protein
LNSPRDRSVGVVSGDWRDTSLVWKWVAHEISIGCGSRALPLPQAPNRRVATGQDLIRQSIGLDPSNAPFGMEVEWNWSNLLAKVTLG